MEPPLTDEGRRVAAYLNWAESIGGEEPRFIPMPGTRITCMVFENQPDPGWRVALTYGMSLHERDGVGNELLLCIASQRDEWLLALTDVAHERREISGEVQRGMTSAYPSPVAQDSPMTGFVFWTPLSLPEEENGVVHLPGRHVLLMQAVPLHPAELSYLRSLEDADRERETNALLRELGESMYETARPAVR